MEAAKEEVLLAERAILYAIGFELSVKHPYTTLVQVTLHCSMAVCTCLALMLAAVALCWHRD